MPGKKKTCFVISPIGAENSEERKWADRSLKYIFRASLEPRGYTVIRADEISETGSITHQILGKVTESELVIADLTDHNPNVFYELAVRDAIARPVIRVIKAGQRIPFDVADLRTIPIDLDVEAVENAREAIAAQAAEIESGNVGTTPVKIAGVLKHLESAESDEKIILRQLIDGISELRTEIGTITRENSIMGAVMISKMEEVFHEAKRANLPKIARKRMPEQDERELITRYLAMRGVTNGNLLRKAIVEISPAVDYELYPSDVAVEVAVADWLSKNPHNENHDGSEKP